MCEIYRTNAFLSAIPSHPEFEEKHPRRPISPTLRTMLVYFRPPGKFVWLNGALMISI